MPDNVERDDSKKKKIKKILWIGLLVFVCLCVALGIYLVKESALESEYGNMRETLQGTDNGENKIESPVDFEALQKDNDEIYAWITIDDTNVNYPVVQSSTDDAFYLKHSAVDKSWKDSGAIYTESCNGKDFNDPITVIYGHNGYSDIMFTTLHKFEDKKFFDKHEYFSVYVPGKKLTYQIISAFKYDDRHIMNTFDFTNADQLAAFQAMLQNPQSSQKNVRNRLDVDVNENSKILLLSTCITGQKSNRYIISSILVKTEETY